MYLEMNLIFLYNLVCQLDYNLLFVKFIIKRLTLKINQNHQYHNKHHVWEKIQVWDSIFVNYHHLVISLSIIGPLSTNKSLNFVSIFFQLLGS